MLINKWSEFTNSLNLYYQKYIKDKQYKSLFEKLADEAIDKSNFQPYQAKGNIFTMLFYFCRLQGLHNDDVVEFRSQTNFKI